MPRVVEDDRNIDALTGQARPRAARQDRGSGGPTGSDGGFNIGRSTRKDHAHGQLAVIRRVGSVKRARGKIKLNLALQIFFEQRLQLAMS